MMLDQLSWSSSENVVTYCWRCAIDLCVTNTLFHCRDIHKVTWRHPRSWHQLDLVITRRVDLASVLHTCTCHSTDCDTDHSPVVSKVRLVPRKMHHSKKKGRPQKTHHLVSGLQEAIVEGETLDLDTEWSHLCDAVYSTTITVHGKEHKNID